MIPSAAHELWIVDASSPAALDELQVGGKARNLAALLGQQAPVPFFFTLRAAAFDALLAGAGLVDAHQRCIQGPLAGDDQAWLAAAAELRQRIVDARLPEAIARALQEAYGDLQRRAPGDVAVRSSGVGEDAAGASFAGQFESVLYVRDERALLDAVKQCWASALAERNLLYRKQRRLLGRATPVAVVVQRMIDPDAAGVMFTADPTSGELDTTVVTAAYGCGEGVVQGSVEADLFKLRGGRVVERTLARKQQRVVRGVASGSALAQVASADAARPVLDEQQLLELAAIGARVAKAFGQPQDIEWAFADGALFLVQARPITVLPPRPTVGVRRLWDNSNIVESYPGVTTPLTFSFARGAYTVVYEQFCRAMGVSDAVIEQNCAIFGQMIGLLRGRIYYNLQSWYQLVSLLPGYEANRTFMEQMMGVAEAADLAERPALPDAWQRLLIWPRTAWMALRLLYRLGRLPHDVRAFEQRFAIVHREVQQQPIEKLSLDELQQLVLRLERQVMQRWQAPIITDFFAMIFYGLLRSLCTSWVVGDSPGSASLQNDLLSGIGGLASAEPARLLMAMAEKLRADPALLAAFAATPDSAAVSATRPGQPLAALQGDVDHYLAEYADRCMEELKLETIPLRDDPSYLFAALRGFVERSDLTTKVVVERERAARDRAERLVRQKLGALSPSAWIFGYVLGQARRQIRNRELMRLSRSKIFGVARRIFLAAGDRLTELGVLDTGRDVLYLDAEEIWNFLRGTGVSADLRSLVQQRRAEFKRYRTEPAPPARLLTTGVVAVDAAHQGTSPPAIDGNELRGTGACPGVVRGPARVVREPRDAHLEPGEILIAERTDPGWVPLFVACSGLLVERGGLLSHSAIVAREFGIPTIVGIAGLLQRVRTGDRIWMDGTSGAVRVEGSDEPDSQARPV